MFANVGIYEKYNKLFRKLCNLFYLHPYLSLDLEVYLSPT